jgi:hypothetical protein
MGVSKERERNFKTGLMASVAASIAAMGVAAGTAEARTASAGMLTPPEVPGSIDPLTRLETTSAKMYGRTAIELRRAIARDEARERSERQERELPTESELSDTLRRIGGCESAGSPDAPIRYHIYNSEGSGASGGFQIEPETWDGRYGVENAADATPREQNKVAEEIYEDRGTEPWVSSEGCWG